MLAPNPEYTQQSDDAYLYGGGGGNLGENTAGLLGKRGRNSLEENPGGDEFYFVLDSTPQQVMMEAQRQPGEEGKGWSQGPGQGPKKKRKRTTVSRGVS